MVVSIEWPQISTKPYIYIYSPIKPNKPNHSSSRNHHFHRVDSCRCLDSPGRGMQGHARHARPYGPLYIITIYKNWYIEVWFSNYIHFLYRGKLVIMGPLPWGVHLSIYTFYIQDYISFFFEPSIAPACNCSSWMALWPGQTKQCTHHMQRPIALSKHLEIEPWQGSNEASLWYTRLGLCSILPHPQLVGPWNFGSFLHVIEMNIDFMCINSLKAREHDWTCGLVYECLSYSFYFIFM